MKVVALLMLTLVVAYGHPAEKRFLLDDLNNIFHTLQQQLNHIISTAKHQFDQLAAGYNINFDDVVALLVTQIDSGTTEAGCATACVAGAATILGPAAPVAHLVCAPACKAALAKLEEVAG